jgi:hypothetical protein
MSSLPRGRNQRTTDTARTRKRPPHPAIPFRERVKPYSQRMAPGHLNRGAFPCFVALTRPRRAFVIGGAESSMGCKQYARMLGLSRGYPYILYLSLKHAGRLPLHADCTIGRSSFAEPHPDRQFPFGRNGGAHRHVDVLKNFSRSDSLRAVGRLNQIVAGLPLMFSSEHIVELERSGKLPGPDQKSCPVDLPFAFYFPHRASPFRRSTGESGTCLKFFLPAG